MKTTAPAAATEVGEVVVEDLIEEISNDGMCGVY
ncbi:MAG: mycofactocin precursor MftA [Nocardioides sp.]|nr:mycofactocin precursor MftA [Nocardioides sp.]MDE0777777.1 mycofactocin precursor MftA [Nocardioides sp.]